MLVTTDSNSKPLKTPHHLQMYCFIYFHTDNENFVVFVKDFETSKPSLRLATLLYYTRLM